MVVMQSERSELGLLGAWEMMIGELVDSVYGIQCLHIIGGELEDNGLRLRPDLLDDLPCLADGIC